MYLSDNSGRKIDYLRVSVTDRCNLRCNYCMPPEGVKNIGHGSILRYDQILRIISIVSDLGIKKIKITGGEPLVRKGIEELVTETIKVSGIEEVTLTTNGVLLEEKMDQLYNAGIRKINISLDSINRERYAEVTGFDSLGKVLKGIKKALEYDNVILKLNALALRETTWEEILELAQFAHTRGIILRFIEVMPMGMAKGIEGRTTEELLRILEGKWGEPRPLEATFGNGPATYFQFEKSGGKVGFISPISHKFCSSCNRIRLTADGILKTCLNYEGGLDLKKMLAEGESNETISRAVKEAIAAKPQGHCFHDKYLRKATLAGTDLGLNREENNLADDSLTVEKRIMSRIGG